MSQRKPTPAKPTPEKPNPEKHAPEKHIPEKPSSEAPETTTEAETVTLAHNIRTPTDHFRAGQTYPVGNGAGEIHPGWLEADPRLDAAHPNNLTARSKREALQQKIRARSFEDHKTRQRLLANVGQGPPRRRIGLV